MEKIKILEIIRQGKIGGGESHVIDLALNLDKEKYTPVILSFTEGAMIDIMNKNNINTSVIQTEKAFDRKIWNEIKNFIEKENISLIHAHGTRAMSNVFWAAQKLNIPIIYTVHGWSFHIDQNFIVRKARELMERFLTNKATKTICVSHSNQKDGIKRFNLQRSTVIYNAVDLKRFNPNKEFKDIRAELNIPKEKIVIGYIVRVTKQKDPFTMINAMKIINKQYKDIVLLMVGDGDLKNQTIQLVKKENLEDHVIFQPFRTDVPDILNAIDIYCLPSLWEGFPIGIIEALAMKKAVISSPVNGNGELINNGETGITIPFKHPEKLAQAIIQLHKDKKLQNSLAENGYNKIINNFGVKRMIIEIEKLYSTILNN